MPRRGIDSASTDVSDRYEIELVSGLERFVDDELSRELGRRGYRSLGTHREGRLSIRYGGPAAPLLGLRSAAAVHAVERFDAPRPRALLGHESFTRLAAAIERVVGMHPAGSFRTLRVRAAGSNSSVLRRLRGEIASVFGLDDREDAGHLSVSIRRAGGGVGWEALIRLTPMPLSARAWRVCNRADALNATIAHAMVMLPGDGMGERFVNLGCGSGTLPIERAAVGGAGRIVGVDADAGALACARENAAAAGVLGEVELLRGDMRRAPLRDGSFDTAASDLPFGMARNRGDELDDLYDAALREAGRLVRPGGAFAAYTARRRLFEAALARHGELWRRAAEVPLRVSFHRGYIAPSIYLLRRR